MSSSPPTFSLTNDNFLTQNEWVRRSQCDARLPFCNLLGKKRYLYKPKTLEHWVRLVINPFYNKIMKILGVDDISSTSAKKYPLFEGTDAIFGELLSAPLKTKLQDELPELNFKLIGVILINQIKMQNELGEVISFFTGIVTVALLLFSINLSINITRLTYMIYKAFCTEEYFKGRRLQQTQAQLDLGAELAPLQNAGQNNRQWQLNNS